MTWIWESKGVLEESCATLFVLSTLYALSFILALVSIVGLKLLFVFGISNYETFFNTILHKNQGSGVSVLSLFELVLWYGVSINIVLAILSLTPFPPFGGGVIINKFIAARSLMISNFLSKYGFMFGMLFIYFVAINYLLNPVLQQIIKFIVVSNYFESVIK